MIPHIVLVISPNELMQFQTEILLRSILIYGQTNYECTLFIEETECKSIKNDYILKNAEIKPYKSILKENFPTWITCPRWEVIPRSELLLMLDCDVVALSLLKDIEEFCKDFVGICGSLASLSPFKKPSFEEWKSIFKKLDINGPDIWYKYKDVYNKDSVYINDQHLCPFYINHGVIYINSKSVEHFNSKIKELLLKCSTDLGSNYFFPQIITTLAIYELNILYKIFPDYFHVIPHHLKNPIVKPVPNNTIFYHYNKWNKTIVNIDSIKYLHDNKMKHKIKNLF